MDWSGSVSAFGELFLGRRMQRKEFVLQLNLQEFSEDCLGICLRYYPYLFLTCCLGHAVSAWRFRVFSFHSCSTQLGARSRCKLRRMKLAQNLCVGS